MRKIIQFAASRYKGSGFVVSDDFDLAALMGYVFRRIFALIRCVLKGVVVSTNVSKLVFVYEGVRIYNKKYVQFGRGVTLGRNVSIDGLSRQGVVIGNDVNIGPYTIIQASGSLRDLGKGISIGDHSGVGAFSFFGASGGITIGTNVIMGQRVSFHSSNHNFDRLDIPIRLQGVSMKGIEVGDDCWIGANCVFLDGAVVGSGCVVAAGSVVRGVIPPNSVVGGVPARILKTRG